MRRSASVPTWKPPCPPLSVGGADAIDSIEGELQNLMLRLRYAQVPVVSAIHGMALGGGCELAVYSARRVAHMESYIGLVEVGVGLIPGAGGLTYIARRAAEKMQQSTSKDLLPFLTEGFTAAAMAKVGTSAIESRKLGYLLDSDIIVPHKDEVLFTAINEAKALAASGWRAPLKRLFPVAGRSGIATIQGATGEHARRRLHQRLRLQDRQHDCRSGLRRRSGWRHPGDRRVPAGAGAQSLLPPDRPTQNARAHFGHAQHRQAGAQLMRRREKSL